MTIYNWIVIACWAAIILYWIVSAVGIKKDVRAVDWRSNAIFRFVIIVLVIIALQWSDSVRVLGYHFGPGVQALGTVLCAAGIAFAIWARWHLGKDWSPTPSMKEGHELVTSGPYRSVRHPIYTGMLLAMVGSALVAGVIWIGVFIIFLINFIYRIPLEERYMMQLFPDQYPEYRKRTKALIPFVW